MGACDVDDGCFAIEWVPDDPGWCRTCVDGGITLDAWAQTSGDAQVRSKECWANMPCSVNVWGPDYDELYTCESLDARRR